MNSLISLVVVENEPRVDSRIVASQLGVEHKNTRELVEQYPADFEEFGVCRFETAKPPKGSSGGRPEKFYLLNEDQSYLLLTYSQNTPQARDLKKRLVRAFGEHRRALAAPDATPPQPKPVRPPIRSRTDLSFTRRDELGRLRNWVVDHVLDQNWHVGVEIGKGYFEEVLELARHNPNEARWAVQTALVEGAATNFRPGGWGIECGFSEAIALALFSEEGVFVQTPVSAPAPAPAPAPTPAPTPPRIPARMRAKGEVLPPLALPPVPVVRQSLDQALLNFITQQQGQGAGHRVLDHGCWPYRQASPEERLAALQRLLDQGAIVRVQPLSKPGARHKVPVYVARPFAPVQAAQTTSRTHPAPRARRARMETVA